MPALSEMRLAGSLAASMVAHALLIAALATMAPGGRPAEALSRTLQVSLRAAPPEVMPATAAPVRPKRAASRHEAQESVLPPQPRYYRASELTERPLPLAAIEPRFPPGAPDTGRMKLRLYINEAGAVDAIDITEAEPAGVFETSAAEAFAAARFRPGYRDGAPVKSQVALEVLFGMPLPLPARNRD